MRTIQQRVLVGLDFGSASMASQGKKRTIPRVGGPLALPLP
jgi:hypothetical protein